MSVEEKYFYDAKGRPLADIHLENPNSPRKTKTRFLPIIDSGADYSMVPKGVGELLNFKPPRNDEIKRVRGVGGRENYVSRDVYVWVGSYRIPTKIAWLYGNSEISPVIGRDIFKKFNIEFKQDPEGVIIFKSKKKHRI